MLRLFTVSGVLMVRSLSPQKKVQRIKKAGLLILTVLTKWKKASSCCLKVKLNMAVVQIISTLMVTSYMITISVYQNGAHVSMVYSRPNNLIALMIRLQELGERRPG